MKLSSVIIYLLLVNIVTFNSKPWPYESVILRIKCKVCLNTSFSDILSNDKLTNIKNIVRVTKNGFNGISRNIFA